MPYPRRLSTSFTKRWSPSPTQPSGSKERARNEYLDIKQAHRLKREQLIADIRRIELIVLAQGGQPFPQG